jgi:regulator of protease activity HflC (stomatin/prohibitin superfamily)
MKELVSLSSPKSQAGDSATAPARLMRNDFRFGAINLILLMLFVVVGAIAQSQATAGGWSRAAVRPDIMLLLGGLCLGAVLTVCPKWQTLVAVGVLHWVLMQALYRRVDLLPTYIATYAGLLASASVQVAHQWEKGIVLRLGKFRCLKGPGFFLILPLLDRVDRYIDHRVRATDFNAETTLTRDTVPVNVDAIAFWLVWDAKMSVLEVADFEQAVILSAQTALRDAIGRHELAQMLSDRERLGHEIQQVLDRKTDPWGITIQSVEIRDIIIPKALEDAMSRQAQAERERQSRVILGTAETEIAEKFALASEAYRDNPVALHLRAMNMVFEGLKQKGSMIIVPSTAVETMGLGALGGLTAFGQGVRTPARLPEEALPGASTAGAPQRRAPRPDDSPPADE